MDQINGNANNGCDRQYLKQPGTNRRIGKGELSFYVWAAMGHM